MKTIKTILTSIMLLLSLTNFAQSKQEIIMVKIYQNYSPAIKADSYIQISYPNETTKTIELITRAGFKMDDPIEDANTKTIQKTINTIIADGYQLLSSDISGDYTYSRTLMIFTRKTE